MLMVYEYMNCSNNCKVEKHSNMNGIHSHKEGGDNGMKREVYVDFDFFSFLSLSKKKSKT